MGHHITRRTFLTATSSALALTALGTRTTMADDDKPTITVGSANYTEQFVMAEFIALLLEDAGYPVERKLNLGGTAVAHEALVSGEVDTYPEYTGSGLMAILNMDLPEIDDAPATSATTAAVGTPDAFSELPPISKKVFDIVQEEYRDEFDVEWLLPFGFNNTYTMAVTRETADELGLSTISDLAPYADDMILGSDQEFPVRPDGLPGFVDAYGFEFEDVTAGDIGLMYGALDQGDVDVITAYLTDGRIPKLDLVVLEDDLHFFPPYNAAPLIRQEVLDTTPALYDVINQLAGKITNEMMASVNYRVDEDGLEPREAAQEFLQEQGFLKEGS